MPETEKSQAEALRLGIFWASLSAAAFVCLVYFLEALFKT